MHYIVKYVRIPNYHDPLLEILSFSLPYIPAINTNIAIPGYGSFLIKTHHSIISVNETIVTVFLESRN